MRAAAQLLGVWPLTSPLDSSLPSKAVYSRKFSDMSFVKTPSWKPAWNSSSVQLCSFSRSSCSASEILCTLRYL